MQMSIPNFPEEEVSERRYRMKESARTQRVEKGWNEE